MVKTRIKVLKITKSITAGAAVGKEEQEVAAVALAEKAVGKGGVILLVLVKSGSNIFNTFCLYIL